MLFWARVGSSGVARGLFLEWSTEACIRLLMMTMLQVASEMHLLAADVAATVSVSTAEAIAIAVAVAVSVYVCAVSLRVFVVAAAVAL